MTLTNGSFRLFIFVFALCTDPAISREKRDYKYVLVVQCTVQFYGSMYSTRSTTLPSRSLYAVFAYLLTTPSIKIL
jgi:hypothetical protein